MSDRFSISTRITEDGTGPDSNSSVEERVAKIHWLTNRMRRVWRVAFCAPGQRVQRSEEEVVVPISSARGYFVSAFAPLRSLGYDVTKLQQVAPVGSTNWRLLLKLCSHLNVGEYVETCELLSKHFGPDQYMVLHYGAALFHYDYADTPKNEAILVQFLSESDRVDGLLKAIARYDFDYLSRDKMLDRERVSWTGPISWIASDSEPQSTFALAEYCAHGAGERVEEIVCNLIERNY
jgi:hypothetical protein